MRRPFVLILLVGAAILLSACATRGSVRRLDARLQEVTKDLGELRRQQGTTASEMAAAATELRIVSGRLRDTDARLRDAVDRIAALGNRVAALETSLREVITAVEALPRVPPSSPPASIAPPGRPPARVSSVAAEQAFAAALKTFQTGEHGQAVLELTDFVGKYPSHPLAPRAQLWIGEAYVKQRDYRQALVEFRRAVDASPPESAAAADAWLKIGQAYAALRERPAATAAWQRVLREYPDTEAAGRARTLLRK